MKAGLFFILVDSSLANLWDPMGNRVQLIMGKERSFLIDYLLNCYMHQQVYRREFLDEAFKARKITSIFH